MTIESKSEKERRLFERFDARFPAKLKDSREEFGEKIYLRNACAQGAQLALKDHVYVNDSLTVEVKIPQANYPVTIRGKVVWVQKDLANFWDVGVKFHQISFMQLSKLFESAQETYL